MNTHEQYPVQNSVEIQLELQAKDIKMPISFEIKPDGYLGIGSMETRSGIGGKLYQDKAKLSHIYVPENLRSKGVGEALVKKLEEQLTAQGISKIFAVFGQISTIKFFLHQGYDMVPLTTLTKEEQTQLGIDEGTLEETAIDKNAFDSLRQKGGNLRKKILLMKEIGKK